MTPQRKELVRKLRDEGYQARMQGRHVQTCPYRDMNRFQWETGWYSADQDVAERQAGQEEPTK